MSVNKYIIRRSNLKSNGNTVGVNLVNKTAIANENNNDKYIKIPISLDFNSVDQAEVVNRNFISHEVEKSINPIVDYEKVRFTPTLMNKNLANSLTINLKFLNKNGGYSQSTYADIGFSDNDIKFQKNSFKNSFLKFSFYDSDKPTNQNLVSTITLFSRLHLNDLNPLYDGNGNILIGGGLPKNANEIPIRFNLDNPIITPKGFAEGYYIYHFKTEISDLTRNKSNIPSTNGPSLYMKATYNNAATGKITKFITTDNLLDINELIKKLHVRYLLRKDATGYYYSLDTTYNNADNISESTSNITLDLYEIRVE